MSENSKTIEAQLKTAKERVKAIKERQKRSDARQLEILGTVLKKVVNKGDIKDGHEFLIALNDTLHSTKIRFNDTLIIDNVKKNLDLIVRNCRQSKPTIASTDNMSCSAGERLSGDKT